MKINLNNASLMISAGKPEQFPKGNVPQIALSGRSNVGKSSLINSLLNRKSLARTSSSPGKTITVNFYDIDKKLIFADMPGYGYAKRSYDDKKRWSYLTNGYFADNPNFDKVKLILQLVDIRVGPTKDDLDMIEWLVESKVPFVIVLTKADKFSKTAMLEATNKIADQYFSELDVTIIPFSSVDGTGKDVLWETILEYANL